MGWRARCGLPSNPVNPAYRVQRPGSGSQLKDRKAMLVNIPSPAVSISLPHGNASRSPQPSPIDSEGETRFVMAPSDARIEYHFRAAARLCLSGPTDERSAADRGRESEGR